MRVVELCRTACFVTDDNDTNTASLKVASSKRANATHATGAKVDRMSRRLREVARLSPVNGTCEDLLAERAANRCRKFANIGAYMYTISV
jgi:hypothetical protein